MGTATFTSTGVYVPTKKQRYGTFTNHVAAWRSKGLFPKLWDYQIMETEGYHSSGYSDITVTGCGDGAGKLKRKPTDAILHCGKAGEIR